MIVVGAPVHERGWILPAWFDGLAAQHCDITVVLNYGHGSDDTLDVILNEDRFKVILVSSDVEHTAERVWNSDRYDVMAQLRNDLLIAVRGLAPDYFLSCDTDMLLPAGALRTLVDTVGPYDGIAPLTFMSAGLDAPNYLTEELQRPVVPTGGVSEQYAVFGTVLMRPSLYQVKYARHAWGEDIGWAINAKHAGCRLALNADVKVKHVMHRDQLGRFDQRIGW